MLWKTKERENFLLRHLYLTKVKALAGYIFSNACHNWIKQNIDDSSEVKVLRLIINN